VRWSALCIQTHAGNVHMVYVNVHMVYVNVHMVYVNVYVVYANVHMVYVNADVCMSINQVRSSRLSPTSLVMAPAASPARRGTQSEFMS